jgi:hypothetical protein
MHRRGSARCAAEFKKQLESGIGNYAHAVMQQVDAAAACGTLRQIPEWFQIWTSAGELTESRSSGRESSSSTWFVGVPFSQCLGKGLMGFICNQRSMEWQQRSALRSVEVGCDFLGGLHPCA